jgi:hypothetical protein
MAGRQGFEPRYADPESGSESLSYWFALYFPAPCLTVLHGFQRLMLPNCCQVFTIIRQLRISARDLTRDGNPANFHNFHPFPYPLNVLSPMGGSAFASSITWGIFLARGLNSNVEYGVCLLSTLPRNFDRKRQGRPLTLRIEGGERDSKNALSLNDHVSAAIC